MRAADESTPRVTHRGYEVLEFQFCENEVVDQRKLIGRLKIAYWSHVILPCSEQPVNRGRAIRIIYTYLC